MATKIFAFRTGTKYNQDVEDYVNSKFNNVIWFHKSHPRLKAQWNKLRIMNLDLYEPVVVIDIDMMFIHDYMDIIEYPIKRGEFLAARSWWEQETIDKGYQLNGGFQKYYPIDCKYIYKEFITNKAHWEQYYISNKITYGKINGEQNFVEDQVKRKLHLKFIPDSWFIKMVNQPTKEYIIDLNVLYPNNWAYLDNEFHPDIRMVHFMNDLHPVQSNNSSVMLQ